MIPVTKPHNQLLRDFVAAAAKGDVAKLHTFPTAKEEKQWQFHPEANDTVKGDPLGPVDKRRFCAHCCRAVSASPSIVMLCMRRSSLPTLVRHHHGLSS